MTKSIVVLNNETALEAFTGGKLDDFLLDIEKEIMSVVPDVSTVKGRKEIASRSGKASRYRAMVDNAGKFLVSDWKAKSKLVDISRKKSKNFLADLRDKSRQPLTDWEAEEEKKHELLKLQRQVESDHVEAVVMNDLFDREKAIAEKERIAAEKEAETLRVREEKRLADERLGRDRIMKEQAALEAKQEAEKEAEAEKLKVECEAQRKIDESKRIEQAAIDSAKKAEDDRIYAVKRAEFEAEKAEKQRLQAIDDAKIDRENAVREAQEKARRETEQLERDRLAAEAEAKRIADINAADLKHRAIVNNEALECFVREKFDVIQAKKIIRLIAQDKITNITVNY